MKRVAMLRARAPRQRGTSLVEVLVALTLVAVTMMGLLGLQLRSMAFQKDTLDRRTAALIAADFAERVASNYRAFQDLGYGGQRYNPLLGDLVVTVAPTCATASACTPAEVAARDWWRLQREVAARLPGGAAVLAAPPPLSAGGNVGFVEVFIGWSEPQREQTLSPTLTGLDRIDPVCRLAAINITDLNYRCYRAAVFP